MVADLVRLQLSLTRNAFRRSASLVVGAVLGYVFALGYGAAIGFGLFAVRRWGDLDLAAAVTPLGAGLYSLSFVALTLMVFGIDATLDPARFALFPVRARQLMPAFCVVGLFLGAGGLMLVLLAAAWVVAWSWTPLLTAVAAVAAVLGVLGAFLLSRLLTSAFAQALAGRRSRDVAGLAFGVLSLAVGLGFQALGTLDRDPARLLGVLRGLGEVIAWTPFGWAWALPADVAQGRGGVAVVRALLALALVVACWAGWERSLDRGLVSPLESSGGEETVRAGGLADRLYPQTPWGAIAARSLKYWRRDPRRIIIVALTFVLPFLWLGPGFMRMEVFDPRLLLIGPPTATFFFGQVGLQELSYDGSALWTHVVAGIRGWEDRLGRIVAALTVLGPVVVLMQAIAIGLNLDHPALCVAGLAASLGFGCAGIGAGLFAGAVWAVPVPPAGANAFAKSSGGGMAGLVGWLVTTLIAVVAAAPTLGLAVSTLWWGWAGAVAALGAGLLTAAGMLWFGVSLGGRQLERHWPERLKDVTFEG